MQNVSFTLGDAAALTIGGHIVSTHVKHDRRRVHYTSVYASSGESSSKTRSLWKARTDASTSKTGRHISAMLPLELDMIILGYSEFSSSPSCADTHFIPP